MNVVIITHIFWPESEDFRNRALAEELVRRGHRVTVIAPFPNYPLGRIYDGYRMRWRQWEELEGIRVLRLPLYPDHSSSGFRRALNYGSFTLAASLLGPLLVRRPDVIFVHASPMTLGFPAAIFRLLYGTPILLDVVDLWPDAVAGSGMTSSRLVLAAAGAIARFAYRVSSRIIALTEGFSVRLREAGISAERITVIPPWADRAEFHPSAPDLDFYREHGLQGKSCIMHAGNIGPYQDIANVLAAAELLRDDDRLLFVFIGNGQQFELMKRRAEELRLDNVLFVGRVPRERLAGVLSQAAALLVSMSDDPYLSINLPSKLAAYLAMERPLVAAAGGDVAALMEKHRLGPVAEPGRPASLAAAVRELLAMSDGERRAAGERAGELFSGSFEKELLRDRYIAILEELAEARR